MKIFAKSYAKEYPKINVEVDYQILEYLKSSVELDALLNEYEDEILENLDIYFHDYVNIVKQLIRNRGFIIDCEDPSDKKNSNSVYIWIHRESESNEILAAISIEGVVRTSDHEFWLRDEYGNLVYNKRGHKKIDTKRVEQQNEYLTSEGKTKISNELGRYIIEAIPFRVTIDQEEFNFKNSLTALDNFLDSIG